MSIVRGSQLNFLFHGEANREFQPPNKFDYCKRDSSSKKEEKPVVEAKPTVKRLIRDRAQRLYNLCTSFSQNKGGIS